MTEDYRNKTMLTVQEVASILRLGRNSTYDFLSKDCPFPTIRIGHQIRIPAIQFFEWLDGLNINDSKDVG